MAGLTARYRITIDLKNKHAEQLKTIMDKEELTQTEVVRRAIEVFYDQVMQKTPDQQ